MKQKKISKKMRLNKSTIANLSRSEMNRGRGGAITDYCTIFGITCTITGRDCGTGETYCECSVEPCGSELCTISPSVCLACTVYETLDCC
jgi:hypothetical protein